MVDLLGEGGGITEATCDLKKFCKCATVRLPKLSPIAIALLTIPANSVEAERSFSLLRQIQGPQRASNSVKSLEMHSGLSNNFNFLRFYLVELLSFILYSQ